MGVTPKQYKFDNVNYPVSENIKSSADVSEQGRHFVHEPCFTLAQQKWEYVIENTTVIHKSTDAKKGKIQVELAMRWWVSQDKYPLFTTIAVKDFDTYAEAWTYEHAVIEQLRAQLNHPMITRNAFKYFYKPDEKFSRNSFSIQIVQADQKKAFNIERIIRHHSNTTTGYLGNYVRFGIIHQTKIFDEQATPQWQIYQYYDIWIYSIRLSRKVEGPERSRIRSELKNIAKFRNMSWPMMTDKPLQIPFLAQSNFSETMKRWLKRFLRQRKDLGIPFHVQKCNIRAAAHSKVADILHNPFNWQDYHLSQID